jgi:hypothetical protein
MALVTDTTLRRSSFSQKELPGFDLVWAGLYPSLGPGCHRRPRPFLSGFNYCYYSIKYLARKRTLVQMYFSLIFCRGTDVVID